MGPARGRRLCTRFLARRSPSHPSPQTNLSFAAHKGVPVFNAPYANTRSVSELVIAEIVMLARQAGDRSMEIHRGEWNKRSDGCVEREGGEMLKTVAGG